MKKVKDKNVGVLGLGKSGISAANLATKMGYNVFASDSGKKRMIKNLNKKIVTEFGKHSSMLLKSDFIIKSPGIHSDIKILNEAKKKKIMVLSEISFALDNSKHKKIIAITGTNGKTTTTDLISKIVKSEYKNSIVSGNIGVPLSDKALKTTKNTIITIELSSYQLEDSPFFKPDISVLLNITPDHLQHHKTMTGYIKAKVNILKNQKSGDYAVINYDDTRCRQLSKKTKAKIIYFSKKPLNNGVYYDKGIFVIKLNGKKRILNPKINIVGMHNIENILAAIAASYCAGVKIKNIEKTISSYRGVEHRIELARVLNGVRYYNDSKSTNIDSTKVALEAFNENIHLIIGGQDKGSPYTPLKKLIKNKVVGMYIIGEASEKIKLSFPEFRNKFLLKNMKNAVEGAYKNAKRGDIVLLSPACASFDQFSNFEERGRYFKKTVKDLR